MDEMEKLAQWHDSRADFWRDEAIVKLPTEAAEHAAAAATIRAAMAEIERLRTDLMGHNCGTPGCSCYDLCRAADAIEMLGRSK